MIAFNKMNEEHELSNSCKFLSNEIIEKITSSCRCLQYIVVGRLHDRG